MARINVLDPRNPTLSSGAVRVVGGQILEADANGDTQAAGTYTFDVKLPAYALLQDVAVVNQTAWDAGTDADFICGLYADDGGDIDTVIDADEIWLSTSLKTTDLAVGEGLNFNFDSQGGVAGGFLSQGTNTHTLDAAESVDRWIRFLVTTTGTAGSAGVTLVYVQYALPEMDESTYAAT
jgi:hypothetical protein